MPPSCDRELKLDNVGNLTSLYKHGLQGKGVLTPQQVASCVKFVALAIDEEGDLPAVRCSEYPPTAGLKVNVVGGATGAGKTSLIHIIAGGMETDSMHQSDTKCPTIYIFRNEENEEIALLDTAGLCDTQATAEKDVAMQELLINSVAATIQRFDLVIVNFLMCVDLQGRLPPNFCEAWPQMREALGGKELEGLCKFVVTKANGDSKVNRMKLAKLNGSEFWKQLQYSPLKWPVISAGRENLEEIERVLEPMSTCSEGVSAQSVQADVESLAKKRELADRLQQQMEELDTRLRTCQAESAEWDKVLDGMQAAINEAYEELASLGACTDARKKVLRRKIDEEKGKLEEFRAKKKRGELDARQMQRELQQWNADLQRKVEEIRKMEGIGAYFRSLVVGAVSILQGSQ